MLPPVSLEFMARGASDSGFGSGAIEEFRRLEGSGILGLFGFRSDYAAWTGLRVEGACFSGFIEF